MSNRERNIGSKNSKNKSKRAIRKNIGKVVGFASGHGIVEDIASKQTFALLPAEMDKVLDGDKIYFTASNRRVRGRLLAKVEGVIERPRGKILARYTTNKARSYALPCSTKIPRHIELKPPRNRIPNNLLVEVELNYPPHKLLPSDLKGKIVRELGDGKDTSHEIDHAIGEYFLRAEFPAKVLNEAKVFSPKVPREKGRRSLQDLTFITIDGIDARDYDDAVFCRQTKGGWRLWVAIADVSHYVTPGSSLDKEAALRTSSVYFPNRVLPMLPEYLSNGLCSLNPLEDRLVLVCEIKLNKECRVLSYDFYEAQIKSRQRLVYEDVADLVNSNFKPTDKFHPDVLSSIFAFHKLATVLLEKRKKRGSLDFNLLEEVKIDLDESGRVEKIYTYKRNIAHLMIEEAMLLANVCAAKFIASAKLPFCYRVNPPPSEEGLNELRSFLRAYDIKVPLYPVKSMDYAHILKQISGYEEAASLQMTVLRSLQQAIYSAHNQGHFGLSYEAYTQFTSPIRRYPDLLNHRAIKFILSKNKKKNYPYKVKDISIMAETCSVEERSINKAVWQVADAMKCHYLASLKNDIYQGIISHITDFGFFVKLKDIPAEGLVRVNSIKDDYYRYDNNDKILYGLKNSRNFSIGDRVKVKVDRISLDERKIDLLLLDHYK